VLRLEKDGFKIKTQLRLEIFETRTTTYSGFLEDLLDSVVSVPQYFGNREGIIDRAVSF
jgi:hypothetical protein